MGLHKWWQLVTWLIISLFSSSMVEGLQTHDTKSLEAFLCKHVNNEIQKPKTGVFYNVSLPNNFTGMEVSVVRLRSVSFWLRGVNHSFLNVPRKVVPQPNRKRIAILFENLGNLSSHYYNVPNYTMVAPIFGFMAYSSSEKVFIENEKMDFVIQGDPITIHFPNVRLNVKNNVPICAKFSVDGVVEFSNMTKPYVCEAKSSGHYTIVVPSPPKETHTTAMSHHTKRFIFTKWWILGFVIGFCVLVVLILVLVALVKAAKRRKIRKMEQKSEGGEPFDTFWIGETKLPLASMLRTQPVLEN